MGTHNGTSRTGQGRRNLPEGCELHDIQGHDGCIGSEVLRDGHLKEKQDQLHRGIESGSRHTSDGHQSLRGHAYGQIKQCIR